MFWQQHQLVIFRLGMNDSNSTYVSRTFISTVAHFNSAAVWMVWFPVLSVFCPTFWGTFQRERSKVNNCHWYHCHCHVTQLFQISSKIGIYLCFYFLLFSLYDLQEWQHRQYSQFLFSFFLLINTRSCFLASIWWSICITKPQKIYYYYYYYYYFPLFDFFLRQR